MNLLPKLFATALLLCTVLSAQAQVASRSTTNETSAVQRQSGGYQRQGDLVINDSQVGQTASSTGNNQTVTNSAGSISGNGNSNSKITKSGQPVAVPPRAKLPADPLHGKSATQDGDEAFWGKGGFWGNKD